MGFQMYDFSSPDVSHEHHGRCLPKIDTRPEWRINPRRKQYFVVLNADFGDPGRRQ